MNLRSSTTWPALLAVLALAACGGDDSPGSAELPEGGIPSTGVPVAAPTKVAGCLEAAGYTTAMAPGEGDVQEVVTLSDEAGGSGEIEFYAELEAAYRAHQDALGDQEPNSVLGRTETAVYSFAGGDTEAARTAIAPCL